MITKKIYQAQVVNLLDPNLTRSQDYVLGDSEIQYEEAYLEAQRLLQDRQDGYVPYDCAFAKRKEVYASFKRLTGQELLEVVGHSFYWKRCPGWPVILYAKSSRSRKLKQKGLVELCRIRVPEIWIGAGGCRIDAPGSGDKEEEEYDTTPIVISLYLHSIDPASFDRFVGSAEHAVYMVSLFSDRKNAALLNELAEERFEPIV